ncbi:MAG: DUF6582 domain-containing protein [Candidatus Bathyarchaeia archaeon]|jgi:hypothetical protein
MAGKKPGKKPFGRDGPPKGYPKDQAVYADPENWRYPLHTPWHAKPARRYFDDYSNRRKYAQEEQAYIDSRINQALEKFGKSASSTSGRRPPPKVPSRKVEELSLDQLLRLFLGAARLQRAKEMDDSLVSVSALTPDHVGGKVKDYVVEIDLKKRTIMHNCEDWRKNLDSKNMCKHLGKFLLTLDEKRATDLLRELLVDKNQWTFAAPAIASV